MVALSKLAARSFAAEEQGESHLDKGLFALDAARRA